MLKSIGYCIGDLPVVSLATAIKILAKWDSLLWIVLCAKKVAPHAIRIDELKASVFPMAFTLLDGQRQDDLPANAMGLWERFFWTAASFTAFAVILFLTTAPILATMAVGTLMLAQHSLCAPLKSFFKRWGTKGFSEPQMLDGDDSDDRFLDLSEIGQKELEKLVFDAIQSIYPTANLGDSPLLYLRAIEKRLLLSSSEGCHESSQPRPLTQQRANELSKLLIELIDSLKDGLKAPTGRLSDDWGPYASLRFYVLRQQGFRTSSDTDIYAIEWRRLKQKSYNAKLKEYEAMAITSIARSIRELN